MKAVILAAGEGQRMRPLTVKTPKPLLKVNGKPIIEHILEAFPSEIDGVIVAVRYLGDQIKNHIGEKYRHMNIKYVEGSSKGTAYSLMAAKKYLDNERFLFVYGDDIPGPKDIQNSLDKDLSMLVFEPRNPSNCGMVHLRNDGTVKKIIEKPKKTTAKHAAGGMMVLNTNIFNYEPPLRAGEFYLSSLVDLFIRDHKVKPVFAEQFIGEITAPKDLARATDVIKAMKNPLNTANVV